MQDQTQSTQARPVPALSPGFARALERAKQNIVRFTEAESRIAFDELASLLGYVRDRLDDIAHHLPESDDREAMLRYEKPFDPATEMWQVGKEGTVQLDELIERVKAAAWVTQEDLDEEYPELREAAAG